MTFPLFGTATYDVARDEKPMMEWPVNTDTVFDRGFYLKSLSGQLVGPVVHTQRQRQFSGVTTACLSVSMKR